MKFTNLFIFGDSVAFGKYDPNGGWVSYLAKDFSLLNIKNLTSQSGRYFTVYNLSVPGDTVKNLSKRFDNEIKARLHADTENVVVFAIGANDNLDNEFYENFSQLLTKAKKTTDKQILLCYFPDQGSLKKLSLDQRVNYIDAYRPLSKSKQNMFDSKHPNTKGHTLIYKTIKDYFKL